MYLYTLTLSLKKNDKGNRKKKFLKYCILGDNAQLSSMMDTISDTSASGQSHDTLQHQSHDTSHGETFQSFTQGGMPKQGLVDPETARAYQVFYYFYQNE
jgi:hypothetical protein